MSSDSKRKSDSAGYEKRDVDLRTVMIYAGALVGMILGVGVVSWIVWRSLSGPAEMSQAPQVPIPASVPRLEPHPEQDLADLRQKENGLLHQYAWVDRSQGIVRIPIDRAMELLLQRGLPTRHSKGENP